MTSRHFPALLMLFIVTLLSHGLLFLHDGVHVDGWLFRAYILEERPDLIRDFFDKQGLPQTAYLYHFLALFPNFIFVHRLLAFGSLVAIGWFSYGLTVQTKLFSRAESVWLGLFSVTYPAYQFAIELSHLWNLLPYAVFLGGWLLLLTSFNIDAKRRVATAVVGVFCLLFSYMNGSLLVYHFGLWGLLGLVGWGARWWQTRPWARLVFLLLGLLPLLYWGTLRILAPPHGVFADYNEIHLPNLWQIAGWQQFSEQAIWAQLTWAYGLLPAGLLILLAVVYLLLNKRWGLEERPFFAPHVSPLILLGVGLGLLLLAMLPFVLVNKPALAHGFESRVSLLLGWPMGMVLLAVGQLFLGLNHGRVHRAGGIFLLVTLVAFMAAQQDAYFSWQARWVKDLALIETLPTLPEAREYSTLYIADEFVPLRPNGELDRVNQQINRRFFQEMLLQFREAYGPEQTLVGIDIVYLEPTRHHKQWVTQLRDRTSGPGEDIFFLAGYEPEGCAAILRIEPTAVGEQMSKLGLARRYWQYRWLSPEQVAPFLSSLLTLTLEPLPCP